MNALILTLFVSTGLAVLGVTLFAFSVRNKNQDHADRLSLLPLGDDVADATSPSPSEVHP